MRHLWLLVMIAACSDETRTVGVRMTTGERAPAYGEVPFPTDAVREGDRLGEIAGIETLVGRREDLVVAHLASLDGFGLRPLVEFPLDGKLDAGSAAGDIGGLVDVDPASPERGRTFAVDWHYDAERDVIACATASGVVLREGTRYAAFVTTAIRDERGQPLRAGSFTHLRGRWQTTADAARDLNRDDLAGLAVFTTQHATAPLVAARTQMLTAPPPVLAFPDPAIIFQGRTALDRVLGVATRATEGPRAGLERWGHDNPTGIAHDHVGVIGTGTMTIARFRGDDTKTDLPGDETFESTYVIEPIPVTFILPAAAPPPEGYPVVIYGHGLSASRAQLLSFAEPLTKAGFALVGIDMVAHGSRYDATDTVANIALQVEDFTGDPDTRDGFGDAVPSTFDFFEGFLNVSAVRDAIRQSALDQARLVQLVKSSPDLSPLGPNARLDARRLTYMGESFGTVVGTLVAAIEPDVGLFVLDVPGGGILDLLLPTSAEIGALALPIIEIVYNPPTRLDRWNPMIGLMQAVIDGADPLSYAPHVLRDRFTIGGVQNGPRSVVAIEVVGDQVLSNQGTEALALALGLDALAPHLEIPTGMASIGSPAAGNRDGQTAVLVQYAPATHGANWSGERGLLQYMPNFPADGDKPFPKLPKPIEIENPIYETLEQVVEVLETYQRGEAPRVRMTKPPVKDFDADGVPDAMDASPYDPEFS